MKCWNDDRTSFIKFMRAKFVLDELQLSPIRPEPEPPPPKPKPKPEPEPEPEPGDPGDAALHSVVHSAIAHDDLHRAREPEPESFWSLLGGYLGGVCVADCGCLAPTTTTPAARSWRVKTIQSPHTRHEQVEYTDWKTEVRTVRKTQEKAFFGAPFVLKKINLPRQARD